MYEELSKIDDNDEIEYNLGNFRGFNGSELLLYEKRGVGVDKALLEGY